jgi:peptidoglycan/xylan/chitin deacetylase (PgdA/CDA1 family)
LSTSICAMASVAAAVPVAEPMVGEGSAEGTPSWGHGMPTDGATRHRWLLLTFDDGPRPETTGPIARILLRARVPAVFFVNGEHLEGDDPRAAKSRAMVVWLARQGFTIGNHGLRHRHMGTLDLAATREEIVANETLLRHLTGRTPWLFRPPYGAMTRIADAICTRRGLTRVGWSLGAEDTSERTPHGVLAQFRHNLSALERRGIRGGIVVLHDRQPWTATALSHLLAWIRARNCELLAEGEEVYELVGFDRFWAPRTRDVGPDEYVPAPEPIAAQVADWQARARAEAARHCPPTD